MKKRTYKQMQNRLYREIKRRIIAEQAAMFPVQTNLCIEPRRIDTLKIKSNISKRMIPPGDDEWFISNTKRKMAYKMADKLIEDGYITFYQEERPDEPLYDYAEIEASLYVAKR